MPYWADNDPRRLAIRNRGAQNQAQVIPTLTRLRQLRQQSSFLATRISGGSMTQPQLDAIEDFGRTNLVLNEILTRVQVLIADPSKGADDYVDVTEQEAHDLYNGSFSIPLVYTTTLWATPSQLQSETDARAAADSILQANIDGKYTLPSGGTTLQYLRGDGTLAAFPSIPAAQIQSDWTQSNDTLPDYIKHKPSLGSAALQDSSAFDSAGAAAAAQSAAATDATTKANAAQDFSIQRANHTGTQLASTISDFSTAALLAVTWSTLTGKPSFFSGAFSALTGRPTTLSGYGITDAYPLSGNPSSFITQAQARTAISLTTAGTGAATYDSATGVLNIPTPVIPNPILAGGSAATTAILLGAGSVDLTVPISPTLASTSYQAVAALTNAPVSILGNIALTIKTKNTNSVVVTLKNNGIATLAIGQVVDVVALKT